MKTNELQRFATPKDGEFTDAMQEAFRRDGVIVLEDFASVESCVRLKERMLELIDEFDPGQEKSVFFCA